MIQTWWSSDGVIFAVVSRPHLNKMISGIGGLDMGSPALRAGASVALLDHRIIFVTLASLKNPKLSPPIPVLAPYAHYGLSFRESTTLHLEYCSRYIARVHPAH
jgi:hypothetical protein